MDRFDRNTLGTFCQTGSPLAGSYPYSYLAHADIAPYRAMAKQYVLADHMFPTEFGTALRRTKTSLPEQRGSTPLRIVS